MTSFSIGASGECHNCTNEIMSDTQFDFERCTDQNGEIFHQYFVDQHNLRTKMKKKLILFMDIKKIISAICCKNTLKMYSYQ